MKRYGNPQTIGTHRLRSYVAAMKDIGNQDRHEVVAVLTAETLSGAAHIDRLEKDRLVERRKAEDGRAVALHLTPSGTKLRQRLMANRLVTLEGALDGLSVSERQVFGDLLARVLTNLPETEMEKHNICRLCSVSTCEDCPIPGNAI